MVVVFASFMLEENREQFWPKVLTCNPQAAMPTKVVQAKRVQLDLPGIKLLPRVLFNQFQQLHFDGDGHVTDTHSVDFWSIMVQRLGDQTGWVGEIDQ